MPSILRAARWWNPSRDFSIWGFNTHISDPNRSTAGTTDTYNLPTVLLSAVPLPNIFVSRTHLPHALRMFRSNTAQLSSVDNNGRPKYRNIETAVSGVPYAKKTRPIFPSVSSTRNLLWFLSVQRRHISEVGCAQLRASCGKICHTNKDLFKWQIKLAPLRIFAKSIRLSQWSTTHPATEKYTSVMNILTSPIEN